MDDGILESKYCFLCFSVFFVNLQRRMYVKSDLMAMLDNMHRPHMTFKS